MKANKTRNVKKVQTLHHIEYVLHRPFPRYDKGSADTAEESQLLRNYHNFGKINNKRENFNN